MNRHWNTGMCVLALAFFAISAAAVLADPISPTSLTTGTTGNRNLSQLPAQSVGAQGGNVTEVNIAALTITKSWQGYYGNITGVITLQDGRNQTFYNWSLTSFSGRVYATRSSAIAWTTVNCTNATNRTSEETFLGQVAGDGDSVTNTFSLTSHTAFNVGTRNIIANTCYSTYGYVNNNSQSTNFSMLLLSPSDGTVIYTALMNKSVTGFDGRQHDFELLVGENEKTGNIGSTPYFFYTEFN